MEIYLDDCSDADLLVAYLAQAGHDVHTPRSEKTSGAHDDSHLEYAAAHGYTLVTTNPDDFLELHDDWQAKGRTHAGILLIYQDNNKRKDMDPPDIVRAIDRLLASGVPILNALHILNAWR
jgi:hypothetical protein